jgi:hypothetical protein
MQCSAAVVRPGLSVKMSGKVRLMSAKLDDVAIPLMLIWSSSERGLDH